MIGYAGMADTPWWTTLISTVVGSLLIVLTDLRKDLAASRQKRADEITEKKNEEAKRDWYWRQQANELLILKEQINQAVTQSALHDNLTRFIEFFRKNPALLRLSGNREFFSSYCGTYILRQLVPGNASEHRIEGEDFSSLRSEVRNHLSKLMVPPESELRRMEEEERETIIKHLNSGSPQAADSRNPK